MKPENFTQCNDLQTDHNAFFFAPTITDLIRNAQRELYDEKLEHALENARFGIEQRRGHQDTVQPG